MMAQPPLAGVADDAADLLASIRLSAYIAHFADEGYTYVSDLIEADEEEMEGLINGSGMKKPEVKRFRKSLAALCIDAALPGDAAGAGGVPNQLGVSAGDQGGRVAAGLGPIAPMGSVAALFVEHVRAPTPAFLDTIAPIAAANCIPGVMNMAQVTFATATDAKTYGALKGDPLSIESIAFIMKYSAEDSQPPIYRDMNNKCYDKDRSKIMPFGSYMVGLVRHMEGIEPYPNIAVFRGVKADLSADYVKVSPVAWAVAADGWHVGLEGVWFV